LTTEDRQNFKMYHQYCIHILL